MSRFNYRLKERFGKDTYVPTPGSQSLVADGLLHAA